MKEDVLHSNHLAEKEAATVSIFLEVKSVGCEGWPKGPAVKQQSSDALKALLYYVQ